MYKITLAPIGEIWEFKANSFKEFKDILFKAVNELKNIGYLELTLDRVSEKEYVLR